MRALRTAAGRRALQLVLLLGGLLALGFLCGTQAQAAEGKPSTGPVGSPLPRSGHEGVARIVTAPSATAPAAEDSTEVTSLQGGADGAVTGRAAASVRGVADGTVAGRAAASVRGVADGTVVGRAVTSVEVVTERVVTPVRTVVRETSGALDEVRTTALPGATSLPVPGLPVPGAPGVSEPLPGHQLPAPVTPAPGPDRPGGVAPAAGRADRPGTGSAEGAGLHRAAAPVRPSGATYGPGAAPATVQAPADSTAARATAPAGAPVKLPTPSGDPDGALGKQAADGTASRHGDAHAVALDGRAPVRLLAGATARVDAPGTRERHRDIPLFPG